jgi:hypothetical protein
MELRFGRRDQDLAKDRPPTPHLIVSVARGPEVSKVRTITYLCGLRVTVKTYVVPKGPLLCECCQRFGHMQRNCRYAPRCFTCGGSNLSGGCPAPRGQPQNCSRKGNTQRTTMAVWSGKRRRRLLQSGRPSGVVRSPPLATVRPRKLSGPDPLLSRLTWMRNGTTSSEGCVLSVQPLQILSRSRRHRSSQRWPPPGRRPSLKSLYLHLQ